MYQKILYRVNSNEPVKTYTLNTVTQGTARTSYLSIRVLHQLAKDNDAAHPLAASALTQDFYVNDLLTRSDTREDAFGLRDGLTEILNKGGLNLRKWASSDPFLVSDIKDSQDCPQMSLDPSSSIETLGINWNTGEDSIFYTISAPELNPRVTERSILS